MQPLLSKIEKRKQIIIFEPCRYQGCALQNNNSKTSAFLNRKFPVVYRISDPLPRTKVN